MDIHANGLKSLTGKSPGSHNGPENMENTDKLALGNCNNEQSCVQHKQQVRERPVIHEKQTF